MPYDVDAPFGFLDLADLGARRRAWCCSSDGHAGATYELASRQRDRAPSWPPRRASRPSRSDGPAATHPWLSAMFAYYDRHGLPVGTLPLRALLG